MRVQARGGMFRIVQLQGQLDVCTKQNGSCCCGWSEKGRLPFEPQQLWGDDWERRRIRNRLHLTFAGCLGPCAVGNNALLRGRSILADHQQSDTLDGLDPVCLMDVDPATARHTVEYAGRTVVFCAPACKKQFVADPSAYLSA